jgi:DNA polymerase-3 subunit delta
MKIESVYLLAGPETGKRKLFTDELRAAIAMADGQAAEEHRLYAAETGVGELLGLLRNGSLFSSRRIVEYRGAELAKGKEDLKAIADYIAAPAPDALLLLVTDQFYVEKAIEEAVGKNRKKTFFEMFESEKPRWIRSRLREQGFGIDDDGIEALLELVENDSTALDAACGRLAVVYTPGSELSAAQVEAAIAHTRQEDAFSLYDRIATGGLDDALEVLEAVLADRKGDAVQVISALIWSFRRLHRLHCLVEEGEGFDEACAKLQMRSKTLQRQSATALRRYNRRECERIIMLASAFDSQARALGATFERVLLQLLVLGIVQGKGRLDIASRLPL